MSALRTLNLILIRFKLRIDRTDKVGLTYPKSNWKLSLLGPTLWTIIALYLASHFAVDPRIGARSIECLAERANSRFSVTLFLLSLVATLAYFVIQHGMGRITARLPVRWFILRLLVSLSLMFSGFFAKLGAVAFGIGIYAAFSGAREGLPLMAMGVVFIFVGLLFKNNVLPMMYAIGPKLSRLPAIRAILSMSAVIGIVLLAIGISNGDLTRNAAKSTGCHLIVRYE